MADTGLSTAQRQLAHGSKYPYDGGSEAAPAIDWAHVAARGVMADLLDRRGVKWELEKVDLDVRADIVTAVAAIVRAALASRPAEVDDKIPRESNDALIAMAKYWKLDGDWMTCKGCRRSLIASRDGEELAHGEGCKYWNQQHPWAQLRELIARRPALAGGAQ
jgi:hypothetical protein